jgi:hypothetical protein
MLCCSRLEDAVLFNLATHSLRIYTIMRIKLKEFTNPVQLILPVLWLMICGLFQLRINSDTLNLCDKR